MAVSSTRTDNRILSALPAAEYRKLTAKMKRVQLKLREGVSAAGKRMTHVIFPESALISTVSTMKNGATIEVGVTGREGMAGLPLLLEGGVAPTDSFVQVPGEGVRMSAEDFRREVTPNTTLYRLLLRYTQAFLDQTSQFAACNRLHGLSQRCARWLLMTHDQVGGPDLALTHEFLAQMLGVRRAGVSEAVGALARKGLIKSSRGKVSLLDVPGLEEASCECYFLIRAVWERLLPAGRVHSGA